MEVRLPLSFTDEHPTTNAYVAAADRIISQLSFQPYPVFAFQVNPLSDNVLQVSSPDSSVPKSVQLMRESYQTYPAEGRPLPGQGFSVALPLGGGAAGKEHNFPTINSDTSCRYPDALNHETLR